MYFLQQLRKHGLPQELLIWFYTAVIEFTLHASITVWFQAATKQDKNRLQWTVRTAEEITESSLPFLHNWLTVRHCRHTSASFWQMLQKPEDQNRQTQKSLEPFGMVYHFYHNLLCLAVPNCSKFRNTPNFLQIGVALPCVFYCL